MAKKLDLRYVYMQLLCSATYNTTLDLMMYCVHAVIIFQVFALNISA